MTSDMTTFQLLQNALGAAQLRQSVYANNIANIDTPGYKRQDVDFESMLTASMNNTGQDGLGQTYITIPNQPTMNMSQALQVQPQVVQDTNTTVDNNGNNVDVDAEMSKLAENQIHYNALVQDMTSRFARLKSAINGGG